MAVNWGTVETAAVTAVVVTLVVEYLAKPQLEARKDRHLEALRKRRALVAVVAELTLAAKVFTTDLPAVGSNPQLEDAFRQERARHYQRMHSTVTDLFDNVGGYAVAFPDRFRPDLLAYVEFVYAVLLSSRQKRRKAEIIESVGVSAVGVLEPSVRHPLVYLRAQADLRSKIAEVEAEAAVGDA